MWLPILPLVEKMLVKATFRSRERWAVCNDSWTSLGNLRVICVNPFSLAHPNSVLFITWPRQRRKRPHYVGVADRKEMGANHLPLPTGWVFFPRCPSVQGIAFRSCSSGVVTSLSSMYFLPRAMGSEVSNYCFI